VAPDLPPPLLLQDGQQLPSDPDATLAEPAPLPAIPAIEASGPGELAPPGRPPMGGPPPPPQLPAPGQP